MLNIEEVVARVRQLETRFAGRDVQMDRVRKVRGGDLASVFPNLFAEGDRDPLSANMVDVIARDLSEAIAPLPSLSCTSGVITSDLARKFAFRRQRIAASYWDTSNLSQQMFAAADNYLTYGFVPGVVEADYQNKEPRIRWLSSLGCYYEADQFGMCSVFVRKFSAPASLIATQYPDMASALIRDQFGLNTNNRDIELISYYDADQVVFYVNTPLFNTSGMTLTNTVLERFDNPLGRCPVVVAARPNPDGVTRGQFDDILGVQAAKSYMLRLALEGAEKQVQAPIAVPSDVQTVPLGGDSLLRTESPQNVQRVPLNIGDSTFREGATLDRELMTGARFPEGRVGASGASVITGRGVEALMGGYDSQVKTAQIVFANALQKLTAMCFEMDEKLWPSRPRTIRGTVEGTPFEEEYTPVKHIKGDYTCEVTYGFLAGMDPNRALVFLLQLRGDRLVDRATVQKQMPFDVDVAMLQQNVEVEQLRDSLMQGVLAWTQAMGPMAQAGQDPAQILRVIAGTIKGRQKGIPLEDLLADEFERQRREAEAAAQAAAEQQQGMGPGGGGDPFGPGMRETGLLEGVAPGQAGMGPGGRPSVQMLLAGMGADGQPTVRAGVRRQIAA